MNIFLAPADLMVKAELDGDSFEKVQVQLKYTIKSKSKEFNLQNELTRNLRAQIQLGIIYALFYAFNQEILINTNTIPESIATKKTFTKAMQGIEEIIINDQILNSHTRIILDIKNVVELESSVTIE